ncbi:DUF4347 domain-containing protein [Nostoc flagelliforme FACHB-838]|uniref:DUF4347 domain-containing protein n=1 Tax=Nostoc flagelliforme FACHB-838 TaxID=2692904 RepID=A0ABR8DHZ1_9NOSO|nr:DUF4347 domain-containing protein [Nostoc flagelliforme]MBD2529134.1 DUF4347 domain-containing protein [Nostoc flagelliforme FACHB-838]
MKSNQPLFFQASFLENSSILVFIDSQVQDYQDLRNGIKAGAEIYILHPEVDGVEQITQTLSQHQYVESIHIISHGAPGTLYLGNAELSLETLGHYTQELQTWFNSTSNYHTPALILYGCNVGADAGTQFLEKLHNISQATIYASSTAVGNSNLGSNWDLDVRYGKDISHFPGLTFQPEVLVTYAGVFGTGGDKYYTYYDSKEGTKGTVAFTDISSTGIFQSTIARDQQTQTPITLPFAFNFYGNNFNQIIIGENGGISFNGNAQFRNNAIIPSTSSGVPVNSIFPFWDDLDAQITATDRTGKIYTKSESNRFIVQWTNFKAENNNNITFQVVLYKDSNNIDFIYSTATPNDGSTASIGLNKGTLEDSKPLGVAYSVNASTLNGVSSIRFLTEPQLKVNTLAVKEGETITLSSSNFNATDVDNSIDLSKITYTISNLQNGEFRLNGIPKTTFTQQDINSGVVQFVHNGSENAPSFNITLSDGYNTSSQKTPTISFTNINNNPELKDTISSVILNENALNIAASIINSNITLTDVDSSDFNAGNLTVNYSSGSGAEDQLSVNSGNGITLSSGNVSYNGTVFGNIDTTNNGVSGKGLVIRFTNVNATLSAVKALIQNLTYQNISNTPNPSRTISIIVNDGDGGTSTAVSKVINVTAENDAPVNTVPGTQTINEDEILTFTAANLISISDPDAGNNPIKVTLVASKGTLSLNGISGLDFSGGAGDGTDDATLEFKGIITDINKALNGMNFKPIANSNGPASVRILTDDLGNSGASLTTPSDKTISININAINDAPVNTVPSVQTVKEDTNLIFNSANNNLIRVDDVDVNENPTGVLQVTLSVEKGFLTLASITGITFASGNSNINPSITFSGKLADINNALNGLIYRDNINVNGADTLKIITDDLGNVGDGGNKKDEKLININIDAVNDPPVNTVPGSQSVEEDKDLIFSTANGKAITISDVDVNEGTGKLEVTLSVTKGTLTLADTTGIDFIPDSSNGKPSISFTGTQSAINKALDGLAYRGNLNYNGTDTLSIVTSDLGNKGEGNILQDASKTVQINITAVNDAPVNTFPGPQNIEEDKDLVFKSSTQNAISVSDIDFAVNANEIQVILSVTQGKLTLGQTTGLTLQQGNDSKSIILKGTQTNINNALEGLTYRGNQDFNGDDILKILTSDLGNTGSPGELKKEDTVQIKVTAINDAPEITIPVNQKIDEDTDLALNGINSIQVKDVDAAESTDEVEVKLSVTKGTLTLKDLTRLTLDATNGNGKSNVIFRGKIADVNIALNSLVYRGNLNANGIDILTITTSDLGNTGTGGILTDTKKEEITITPVNDAPINNIPQNQKVDENKTLIFSAQKGNAISISDVDVNEGTGEVEVTLAVSKGVLTLEQVAGITFKAGDGKSNATMTLIGKVADINKALEGIVYQGNKNYSGQDSLTITTSDLSNFGTDILIDTDIISISVIPDTDNDGVSNSVEEEVALEIAKQNPTDSNFKSLSQKAASDPGVVALFGQDGTKKPIIIAINEQDQKQLGGTSQTLALVINIATQRFNDAVPDSITAFDSKDLKKSSLTKLVSALDVINFEVMSNPVISEDTLQQKIKEGIKQKPVRVEIKLPDGPDDLPVNTILIRKSDGTLYDFRRLFNPNRGESDDDALTGAVLQDRNLDGKADWAVVYLQDGKWGDEDDLVNAKIANSLVAANWDLGASRMKVRPIQDGLNFYGNRSYVQFTLDRFSGLEASEVGMARVRFDSDGQIIEVNGKSVKSTEEAKQTIIQRGETLFSSLSNKNRNPDIGIQTRTVAFEEGEQAVFFVIQNGTKDELLFKGLNSNSVQFSLPTLNNGGAIMTASSDKFGQTAKLSLAGLFNLSAKFLTAEEARSQLGLLAISQSQAQSNTIDELIDLKSSAAFDGKQVKLNLSLQREAANNNSAYLYRVDDAKGSIRDPLTGMLLDPTSGLSVEQKQRYLELITTDRLVQGTEIQASNLQTQEISVNLTGGEYYLPFLVSDGTLSSINKDFSRILTSHLGINSDGVDHIGSLGNNKFGFEDLVGGGDRDYNDMILSIRQVQIIG